MTPISALIAAKSCIALSEAAELQKEYDKAIKQAQDAILWLAEWQYRVKEESESYKGADFDVAAVQQYRHDRVEA